MKIINLTPHPINVVNPSCVTYNERTNAYYLKDYAIFYRIIESSGVARCTTKESIIDIIDDILVYSIEYDAIKGLPEPKEGTVYIVSQIVARAAQGRDDLLVPSHLVRDGRGITVGCLSFSRV